MFKLILSCLANLEIMNATLGHIQLIKNHRTVEYTLPSQADNTSSL